MDCGLILDSLGFDESNTLLVVHDVQRLTLQLHGYASAVIFAVDFKAAEIQALMLVGAILGLDHLTHALPTAFIDVPESTGKR